MLSFIIMRLLNAYSGFSCDSPEWLHNADPIKLILDYLELCLRNSYVLKASYNINKSYLP